jgi:hypothetical protein
MIYEIQIVDSEVVISLGLQPIVEQYFHWIL